MNKNETAPNEQSDEVCGGRGTSRVAIALHPPTPPSPPQPRMMRQELAVWFPNKMTDKTCYIYWIWYKFDTKKCVPSGQCEGVVAIHFALKIDIPNYQFLWKSCYPFLLVFCTVLNLFLMSTFLICESFFSLHHYRMYISPLSFLYPLSKTIT